jgi:hypothetical protein
MRTRNSTIALLLAGVGLVATGPTAQAFVPAPGAQPVESCSYRLVSVKTVRLQERRGDEVRIVIGGRIFPTHRPRYVDADVPGQVLSASSFDSPVETFTGAVQVEMFEVDTVFDDRVGTRTESCTPGTRTDIYQGSDARYDVTSEITVG